MSDTKKIDYPGVERAIGEIIQQNKRPTTDNIKKQLSVSTDTFDQIIEYYRYMWEQRHTVTYLETLEPVEYTGLDSKEIAKRAILLEESLAMMRATIEATQDCLLMINKEGKLIGFNQKLIDFVKLPE